jgi:Protein of unknown function (DUF3352)
MRILASGLAAFGCIVAVAGCGAEEAAGPLDEALRYLPADAPFAMAIETDLEGDQYRSLDRIVKRFPFGEQAKRQLEESIEDDEGVDFERDVKPLLGNPFVVGAPDARSVTDDAEDDQFVGAIQAADEGKLDQLLDRSKPSKVGERGGATLYRERDGDTYAVKDDVLIVAGSRKLLESALDRREGGDGLSEDAFDRALEGLPGEALVRLYADLRALIDSDPGSRAAQQVKWVDGLRTLGLTAAAEDEGLQIDYRVRTEGVGEADLPIAPGEESPGVIERPGEVAVGIRDLSRVIEFGEAAGRAVDPSGFGDYEAGKEQIDALLGVSVDDDLIAQLKGDSTLSIAPNRDVAVRAELEDPAAFERTLAKLADVLPRVAGGLGGGEFGIAKPGRGQDLYRLTDSNGKNWFFGVMDDVFVLARSPARARRIASGSPKEVPGVRGSVVVSADAEKLADAAISGFGAKLGVGGELGSSLFTAPLGDLRGSVTAAPDGLTGSLRLGID